MKPLTLLLTFALILAIACGGEPEVIVVTPTPAPTTAVQTADEAPTPKPTVPRINFTPTALPQAAPETVQSDAPKPTHTPPPEAPPQTVATSQPAHHGDDHPEAQLIPHDPEHDDSVTLDRIYDQIYDQIVQDYALDPQGPIDWFQEPNCDYGPGPLSTSRFAERSRVDTGVTQINTAICDPYQVDLNVETLKDGSYDARNRFHHPEHFVLNTSPAETIVNHPYRFAFKNAHIYAMHQPDAQMLKFSANHRQPPSAQFGDAWFQGLAAAYEAANVNAPTSLIGPEDWLAQPWYANIETNEHDDGLELSPIIIFPNESVRDTIADAVADLLGRAEPGKDSGLELTQFDIELEAPVTLSLKQAATKANLAYNEYHLAQWEFLSPYLPIVRVTTYNEQRFPYEGMTDYPKYDRRGQPDGTYRDTKIADNLEEHPPTRYAVSFVVAFQQRWDSFRDETRHEMYEAPGDDHDHDHAGEEYLDRWYASDMMLHSIIGPVVVQVYESPHLTPGVYSKNPEKSHWEKPGYIGASDPESFYHNAGIKLPVDRGVEYNYGMEPPEGVHSYIKTMDDPQLWPMALSYGHRFLATHELHHQPLPGELVLLEQFLGVSPQNSKGYCGTRERWDWEQQNVCYQAEADYADRASAIRHYIFQSFELPQYAGQR